MDPRSEYLRAITRRHFFRRSATGIGTAALAALANERLFAADASAPAPSAKVNPLAPKPPQFAARAKSVIYLHMPGAPSQPEMLDYKPKMVAMTGQPCPDSLYKKERFAFIKGVPKMLGTPYKFTKHGNGGVEISELLPNWGRVADDMTVVRSMVTDQFNHAPAQIFLNTGSAQIGRPSMGSWLTYGLGSECQNLPGFVVLLSGSFPDGGTSLWGSGFLPSVYQGVQFRSQGEPVLYVSNPPGMDGQHRRESLDALADLNRMQLAEVGDPETVTRIAQYEMAYRMQSSVPELMDISREPQSVP